MTNRSIVLDLPEDLYERVKRLAEQAHRTVEQQVIEVVETALPPDDDHLPPDLQFALDQLAFLNDEELWRAARIRLSARSAARLASINRRSGRGEQLSEAQIAEQHRLVREYERVMLVRAQAAVLLKERGHDISVLAPAE